MTATTRTRIALAALVIISTALVAPASQPAAKAQDTCAVPLQTLVNNAAAGSTLLVPACTYGEVVTINKPLTLDGQGAARIRGSNIWTGWTQVGGTWVSTQTVPPFPRWTNADGRCGADPELRCLKREQVFLDGALLTPVDNKVPVAGQFGLDTTRHVVLPSNPAGRLVEVSVRDRWIITASNNVTIKNFELFHCAGYDQIGCVSNDGFSDWTFSGSMARDAHGASVSVRAGLRTLVADNDIYRGGSMGIIGENPNGLTIRGNELHDNGTEGFEPAWGVAGAKMGKGANVAMIGNDVHHNRGGGLWCDVQCTDFIVRDNRVHDNATDGINFEISDRAMIDGNHVWNNGTSQPDNWWLFGAGILVSSSSNATITNNVVAWNPRGISVVNQTGRQAVTTGTNVRGNSVIRRKSPSAEYWANHLVGYSSDGTQSPPTVSDNRYWVDVPEVCCTVRYSWQIGHWQLAAFKAATNDTLSRYLTTTEARAVLTAADMPTAGLDGAAPPPPPAATATPVATSTPVPAPTNTPPPAATRTPVATATPAGAGCEVRVRMNGVEVWLRKPSSFCR